MRLTIRLTTAVLAIGLLPIVSSAQPRAVTRAARAYDGAVKAGPLALHAFLEQFPKGADLHVHLLGAVYAESLIRSGAEDGLCVDTTALSLVAPPCLAPLAPASELSGAALAPAQQDLYDRLIDSFSMRGYLPSPGFSGHDRFFGAFSRFALLASSGQHIGEWVDEVAARSAAQNQQYLELMQTPPSANAMLIAQQNALGADLAAYRQVLLAHGLRHEIAADRDEVRAAESRRRGIEHCGTAQAKPACSVTVRYLYQIFRGFPPAQVFAQALLGFETVQAALDARDDTWVGINLVMPEDGLASMRDYSLQMKMIGFLHATYPAVHIALHAGELAPGLVPPRGLRFHIAEAVRVGQAERIGHGVDLAFEDHPESLLQEMARKHVMIEINLSSNDTILNIRGAEHPLPLYRRARVPVALSTDDEGVSRIDITHEFARAAFDYHLSYADLKQLARSGMEHSFLPGHSLWAAPDVFTAAVAACRGQILGSAERSDRCRTFLDGSQKAAAQWEQETRFRGFEALF